MHDSLDSGVAALVTVTVTILDPAVELVEVAPTAGPVINHHEGTNACILLEAGDRT